MSVTRFLDRRDAGRHLASALRLYARRRDVVEGRTVIVVDDGLATGATMSATGVPA